MLRVYHSNRLERLLAGLSEHLAAPLEDPLAPEILVVQSQGMARWLSLELAKCQGIAANLDFPFLSVLLWRLFQSLLPGVPERSTYDRATLVWRLLHLLPQVRSQPGFEAIDHYLEGASGHKEYQLASRLAELYGQYLVYRPDWILKWGQGRSTPGTKDQSWQPRLWRRLLAGTPDGHEDSEALHPPLLLARILERLQQPDLDVSALPQRISLFGLSTLAPAYLTVFERLAQRLEVNLYVLDPCLAYWGDVVSRKDQARLRAQRRRHNQSTAVTAYHTVGNPLLAALGKLGRDFQEQLAGFDCDDHEWFEEPPRTHLLGWLQADVLNLIDRSEPLPADDQPSLFQGFDQEHPGIRIADDDASIQVHSCHSPLREVEVLHDRLLALFDRDPGLSPSDVLVIAPDIDFYAPFCDAVFGAVPEERRIPYAIADRAAPREHPVIRCLLEILDLPRSRLTAREVLNLLETPQVAERFGLDECRLDLIRQWVDAAGIRWGRDATDRSDLDLPGFSANSWRTGMDRLLLGFALPEAERVYRGTAPLAAVQGQQTDTLGALQGFLAALFRARDTLAKPHSVTAWVAFIQNLIDDFFAEHEPLVPLQLVREALADIQESAAGFPATVACRVVVEELEQRLSGRDSGRNFLTGRLTFANLVPMRSIPFRVICFLGLNNQDFPRSQRPLGFDLMARKPRMGDRSRRDDDRYLFLEALISARDCFYLSYVGRSQRDNSKSQPTVLITELLELIDAGFETSDGPPSARLVVEHSLQPFSPRNFMAPATPDAKPAIAASYAGEWLAGARSLLAGPQPLPPFIHQPLPAPPEELHELDLDELIRFLCHPTRYFFDRRLGVRLESDPDGIADSEPFDMPPLARYDLRRDLLERVLEGQAGEPYREYLTAAGRLPVGSFGDLEYAQADAAVQGLAERLDQVRGEPVRRERAAFEIDLQLQDVHLTGWLDSLNPEGLTTYRATALTAADRLRLWVLHLVLNVRAPADCELASRHLALDSELVFPPLPDAALHLARLLKTYREGLCFPLEFYPEVSLAYAERLPREGRESALRAAKAKWFAKREDAPLVSPYYRFLYGDAGAPLDARFEHLARELAGPIVQWGELSGADRSHAPAHEE